jgi:hypothetical protein
VRRRGAARATLRHAQQTVFASDPETHPQPLAPAALASASRTQQAFVVLGAGPPQHEFVFGLFPASLLVVVVLDIASSSFR